MALSSAGFKFVAMAHAMHFACLWSDKNFNQTENANDVKREREK